MKRILLGAVFWGAVLLAGFGGPVAGEHFLVAQLETGAEARQRVKRLAAMRRDWARWVKKERDKNKSLPPIGDERAERLILNLPQNWRLVASAALGDGNLGGAAKALDLNRHLMVYLPEDKTRQDWTQAILVEKLRKAMSIAPRLLYARIMSQAQASCVSGAGTKPGAYRQRGHLTLTGFLPVREASQGISAGCS